MKLLISIIALISVSAFGAEYERKTASFTIKDRTSFGNRVFYNCDSVENQVEQILSKLGAKDIDVNCRGGLDRHGSFHMPAYVSADFMALNADLSGNKSVSMQVVEFKNRNSCHLFSTSLTKLADSFEISEMDIRRCLRSNDRTRARVVVLKESN